MKGTNYKNFIVIGIILIMIYLSYQILQPYLITLISAFILSYLIYPVFKFFNKKMNKTISALLCILIILLAVLVPISYVATEIVIEGKNLVKSPEFREFMSSSIIPFVEDTLRINVEEMTRTSIDFIVDLTKTFVTKIPSFAIAFFVLLISIFYMLVDMDKLEKELKKYIPFKNKDRAKEELKKKTRAILYGSLLMAVFQGVVAFIGFSIMGTKAVFLLSILIFILAFIPGLGSSIVWFPVVVYYFFTGHFFIAVGGLILGIILSYGIDTILRAKVLGKSTDINPLIMIVGILGGIAVFGIFGIVIGPLVLTYTLEILNSVLRRE